jgi:hypothetical protein
VPDQRNPEQSNPESALDDTIAFWQPIAGRKLSHEDARQIRENLTGFFCLLMEWDEAETARQVDLRAEDRAA